MTTPRGKRYQQTLGQIVDYAALAGFLLHDVRVNRWLAFWDIPCGCGELLHELEMSGALVRLNGLDRSHAQLSVARDNLRSAKLVQADLFAFFSGHDAQRRRHRAFCHMGFCFFNTLSPRRRATLLQAIASSRWVAALGFEIQNSRHQALFRPDKDYRSQLPDGRLLISRSSHISPSCKVLTMTFVANGAQDVVKQRLYDWPLDTCLTDVFEAGWTQCEVVPARYRNTGANALSHWFVLCTKR